MNAVTYRPRRWAASQGSDAELARIAKLGFDTIRLPLPYGALGGGDPDDGRLGEIRGFLDRAAAHRLRVVPVLFDGLTELTPAVWAATLRHLTGVVAALAPHETVVMWDVAGTVGAGSRTARPEVGGWLASQIIALRGLDQARPVMVSWDGPEAARTQLNAATDAVAFGWSGPAASLPAALAAVGRAAAGRPVVLCGYELTTWNSLWPGGHTEAEQARYVADVRIAARRAGIDRVVYGRWRDDVMSASGGLLSRREQAASKSGVIRADGSAKPAARLAARGGEPGAAGRPGPLEAVRKPYWWWVAVTTSVLAFILGRAVWRRSGRLRGRLGRAPGEIRSAA